MRTSRVKLEGASGVYHCISRIVGEDFLLEGEREKEVLRNQIWKVADFCGVEVLTYCIMSNHVHVLIRTPDTSSFSRITNRELIRRAKRIYGAEKGAVFEEGLSSDDPTQRELFREQLLKRMGDVSQFMKELKQRFSIWYNKSHNRKGTLWAERFKSVLIEDEPMALSTVAAYIDLNPVRAGLADDPANYRFCGYAEAMGGFPPARKGIRSLLRRRSWAEAISTYRVAVFGKGQSADASRPGRSVDGSKAASVMNEGGKVRRNEALRCRIRYFVDGVVLGSAGFVKDFMESRGDHFAKVRGKGAKPLQGSDWGELCCGRALRSGIFGGTG